MVRKWSTVPISLSYTTPPASLSSQQFGSGGGVLMTQVSYICMRFPLRFLPHPRPNDPNGALRNAARVKKGLHPKRKKPDDDRRGCRPRLRRRRREVRGARRGARVSGALDAEQQLGVEDESVGQQRMQPGLGRLAPGRSDQQPERAHHPQAAVPASSARVLPNQLHTRIYANHQRILPLVRSALRVQRAY
jgi:hypothetical protein